MLFHNKIFVSNILKYNKNYNSKIISNLKLFSTQNKDNKVCLIFGAGLNIFYLLNVFYSIVYIIGDGIGSAICKKFASEGVNNNIIYYFYYLLYIIII